MAGKLPKGTCKTCGETIIARKKGMSIGAASRLHYWAEHREVMTAWRDEPTRRGAEREDPTRRHGERDEHADRGRRARRRGEREWETDAEVQPPRRRRNTG